jgi:hypothetical protein
MPKKPVELPNGKKWASIGEAEDHFRSIRDRFPPSTKIASGPEYEDLIALLTLYDANWPAEETKMGSGVSYFETRINRTNGGRTVGFWVVRTDGTSIDFSFIKAIAWVSR